MRFKALTLTKVLMVLVLLVAVPAVAQDREALQHGDAARVLSSAEQLVRVTGVIEKRTKNGYQYGYHKTLDQRSKRLYALYGKGYINQNRYVGRRVKLVEKRARGHLIDFGSSIMKVIKVRPVYPIHHFELKTLATETLLNFASKRAERL